MIYVDDYRAEFGRMIMSHLFSDESIEELHEFAQRLGLKRSWFQNGSAPHYDVSEGKRRQAISMGAKEIGCGTEQWLAAYRRAKLLKEK